MNFERRKEALSRWEYVSLKPSLRKNYFSNEKRYNYFLEPPEYTPDYYFRWERVSRGHDSISNFQQGGRCYEESVNKEYLMQLWNKIAPDVESKIIEPFVRSMLIKLSDKEDAVRQIRKYYPDFNPEEHDLFLMKIMMLINKK